MSAAAAGASRYEFGRAARHLLLGFVPCAATVCMLLLVLLKHVVAYDFHYAYYPAVKRLLDGGDPYAVTHAQVVGGTAFVYPPLSAFALVPFALLRPGLSDHVYMLFCLALVPGTLWSLGVRDWRVYCISLLWLPVCIGWRGGNVSIPLCYLVALAWRYRERPWVAGLVTAAAISLKPFVWPLGLWLLATRRWKAAAWAFAAGAVLNLLAWEIVGFNEIHTYLRLSGQVTDALWRGGYSMLAVAHYLGFGRGVGEALLLFVSAAATLALLYTGLVRRREREAMIFAVALMLLASPLVWNHYFVLLLVPLALTRPRFGVIWTAPILMWLCPPSTTVVGWEAAVAWTVTLACFATALRERLVGRWPAGHRPRQTRPTSLATTG